MYVSYYDGYGNMQTLPSKPVTKFSLAFKVYVVIYQLNNLAQFD